MSSFDAAHGGPVVPLLLLLSVRLATFTVGGAIIASDVRRAPLAASTFSDDPPVFIHTHGLVYVLNTGHSIRLDCEFSMQNYSHFHNPVVWKKFQRLEETQMNIMSAILKPFVATDRFDVSFYELLSDHPPRYKMSLVIANLSLEDSGNYTCEIRGRGSVVKASLTHYIFVRAAARHVFFQVDQNISAAAVTGGGPDPCHPRDAESPTSPRTIAFVEGVPGRLSCVTTGGYPPPEIAIKVGADDVTNQFELSYVPTLCGERGLRLMVYETQRKTEAFWTSSADDGKAMTCSVTVPGMTSLTTETLMEVNYAPIASCQPTLATPGERNVHLDCTVRSRPSLTALFWVVDGNGTTVSDGEVVSEYWTRTTADSGDGTVECQLYMRRAHATNFRLYTLVAENNVAITTHRVPLLEKHRSPLNTRSFSPPVQSSTTSTTRRGKTNEHRTHSGDQSAYRQSQPSKAKHVTSSSLSSCRPRPLVPTDIFVVSGVVLLYTAVRSVVG